MRHLIFAVLQVLFLSLAFRTQALSQSVSIDKTDVVRGQVLVTTWAGFSGNVNIAVYKGTTRWVYANTNQPGSGSQSLDTTGWELRNDYRVRVELRSNPGTFRESTVFSVHDPDVSVSRSIVTEGETFLVTWSGFTRNVNIAVYKGTTRWVYANTNQPGSGSQALDTTGWEPRNDYRVRVELRANTSIYAYSGYIQPTFPGIPGGFLQIS